MSKNNSDNSGKTSVTTAFLKVSFVLVLVIAFAILFLVFINILHNQTTFTRTFNESLTILRDSFVEQTTPDSEALTYPEYYGSVTNVDANDLISLRMQYLERLSEMHRQATSNDLFVFIYGFLSTILIGVSAFFVNKGQTQVENIRTKFNDLNNKAADVESKINTVKVQIEGLDKNVNKTSDICAELQRTADSIDSKVSNNENAIFFHFISQVLSDALTSIMCYNAVQDNEYLVQFKRNIHHVSEWCEKVDFTLLDDNIYHKFVQRLGNAKRFYFEEAMEKPGSEIDDFHRKNITPAFTKIEDRLSAQKRD